MDNAILVKEFREIVKVIKEELGHVALFMFKAFDSDIDLWNLIVSIRGYDDMTNKEALKHLINTLNSRVSREILKKIIRMTVLKTNAPFVAEVNRAFDGSGDSVKYIHSSVMSGVYIERGLILESGILPPIEHTTI
ncbi:hypothetical protein QUF72_15485 [Desulfobacterales bacterium HSG2]|nr:hypothetical protein [Desulfobacterales bacterium HSG2]